MKASAELAAEQAEVQRLRGNLAATEAALRSARGKENRLEADLEALTAKLRVSGQHWVQRKAGVPPAHAHTAIRVVSDTSTC